MFKPSKNPFVEELTKSHKERSFNLTNLKVILTDTDLRKCAWCAENTFKKKNKKYCSKQCSNSAMAWAYPQKELGLNALLLRQGFKCNVCQYDYAPLAEQLLKNGRVYDKPNDYRTEFSYWLMRRLRAKSPKDRRPEVDHVHPVHKGGETLGISNHQAVCALCHKAKTKRDLQKLK